MALGVVCLVVSVSVIWLIMTYLVGLDSWKAALGITCAVCIPGSVFGALVVYVVVQRNMQGEAVNQLTGEVDYAYLFTFFVSWFVFVGLTVGLVFGLFIAALYRVLRP